MDQGEEHAEDGTQASSGGLQGRSSGVQDRQHALRLSNGGAGHREERDAEDHEEGPHQGCQGRCVSMNTPVNQDLEKLVIPRLTQKAANNHQLVSTAVAVVMGNLMDGLSMTKKG